MGRPILILDHRTCPLTHEDVELLHDNLPSPQELLRKKLERAVMTLEPEAVDASEFQGLLDALHTVRLSGARLSDDLQRFETELAADVYRARPRVQR